MYSETKNATNHGLTLLSSVWVRAKSDGLLMRRLAIFAPDPPNGDAHYRFLKPMQRPRISRVFPVSMIEVLHERQFGQASCLAFECK